MHKFMFLFKTHVLVKIVTSTDKKTKVLSKKIIIYWLLKGWNFVISECKMISYKQLQQYATFDCMITVLAMG